MSLILQLETATSSCSVALALDGKVISKRELNERNVHASHITVFIGEILKQSGKTMKELSAVAVSRGPGSYTGLRIGVSTAKGICYALDIPLIGINTLEAMAAGILSEKQREGADLFCPMIDARRMEVYCAVFNRQLQNVRPTEALVIDEGSFSELLKDHTILFFGDGAAKCENLLRQHSNARFVTDFVNSAADFTELAYEKYQAGSFENTAYFEPFYLKEFIATTAKAK